MISKTITVEIFQKVVLIYNNSILIHHECYISNKIMDIEHCINIFGFVLAV